MLPLPETSVLGKIYTILETLGWSDWMPRLVHVERWYGLLLGSVIFRLVAHPL
jgi:hypothetical protein